VKKTEQEFHYLLHPDLQNRDIALIPAPPQPAANGSEPGARVLAMNTLDGRSALPATIRRELW